jgi:hypothetical protein
VLGINIEWRDPDRQALDANPDLDLAKLFANLTLSGTTTQVILDRICKNMIILTPQRKSHKDSSFFV